MLQVPPVEERTVMSKFENKPESMADVSSILTAQTLFASVTTSKAYVVVSLGFNVGSVEPPGMYCTAFCSF